MPGGSTFERALSRAQRPFLATLALLAVVAGSVGRAAVAAPPPGAGTWAASWQILATKGAAEGTLSGLQRAKGGGLNLVEGALSGSLESAVHDMGHEFIAVGASWQAQLPAGTGLAVEVRLSADGTTWGPWQPLPPEQGGPDGARDDRVHSELTFGLGRYLQVRATLSRSEAGAQPVLQALGTVAIDSRPGPAAPAVASPSPAGVVAQGFTPPPVISRAGWGANESWMTWPPEYAPVVKFVIHHTATSNASADTDPAAQVRAIYYYHAITRGWGDIGYNFMIDRQGRIYEGRKGGDGVIGGHAAPYNSGTIGVAILGTYTSDPVPAAALSGLETFIAWKCSVHGIGPQGSGFLYDRTFPNIMGHRDCNSTDCPGKQAYDLLPRIRSDVAPLVEVPALTLTQPAANAALSGVYQVAWQVTGPVSQITVAVDDQTRQTLPASATSWYWNTTTEANGSHRLRVTASAASGQSSYYQVQVQVDNMPPTGSLTVPAATNGTAVTLTLACQGCTQMQFGSGWRWEGENLLHQTNTGSVVADPAAGNGKAWLGTVAANQGGAWYGPYYCRLPFPGDYEAVFWLRCGQTGVTADVADIDVVDGQGAHMLGGPVHLPGPAFASAARYQPFRIPFHYANRGTTCQGTTQDGLELRTWFQDTADLWLDRVEILTAPRAFTTTYTWPLPQSEGRYPVEVRYVDAAGNLSPVYTRTVAVDHTAPAFNLPTATGIPVQDALSGLDPSAAYALSTDGTTWGDWVPAPLAVDGAGHYVLPAEASWTGEYVKARATDQAGNVAVSPATLWTGEPQQLNNHSYLPYVVN